MNLHQAQFLLTKYDFLIDQSLKGYEVMTLVIIPSSGEYLQEIIDNALHNESYGKYLLEETDFEVLALLNSETESEEEEVFQMELSDFLIQMDIEQLTKEKASFGV